jgi:hypothetical protein
MIGIPITVAWVEETEVVPLVVVASKIGCFIVARRAAERG